MTTPEVPDPQIDEFDQYEGDRPPDYRIGEYTVWSPGLRTGRDPESVAYVLDNLLARHADLTELGNSTDG